MTLGHLGGWNVRKAPLTATVLTDDGVTTLDAPGFATVRDNPFTGRPEALGVVGAGYQRLQNEDHAEFLNHLSDQSGAIFDTAGCCSPRSGWFAPTPRPPPYAARHAKAAVAAARDALRLTFAYSQKFQAEAAVEPLELLASEREVNRQHHARRPGGRLSWRAPDLVDVAVRQQRQIEAGRLLGVAVEPQTGKRLGHRVLLRLGLVSAVCSAPMRYTPSTSFLSEDRIPAGYSSVLDKVLQTQRLVPRHT